MDLPDPSDVDFERSDGDLIVADAKKGEIIVSKRGFAIYANVRKFFVCVI
jgi:hypothetical protein